MKAKAKLLAAIVVFAISFLPGTQRIAFVGHSGEAKAQSWGQTSFSADPRFANLRRRLLDQLGGGIRPLTFSINSYRLGGRDSYNARPLTEQFISELGATPVKNNAQFEIEFSKTIQENYSGYGLVKQLYVRIIDLKANGEPIVAMANLQYSCNTRRCESESGAFKELLLRLGA